MSQILFEISSVQKPFCDRQLHSKLSRLEATHWRLEIVDLPYMVSPRCKGMPKNFRGTPLSTWLRLVTALQGYPKNSEDLHKRGRERKAQRDKLSIIYSANGIGHCAKSPASKSRFVTGNFTQSSLGWKKRTEGWKSSTFLMVSPRRKGMPKNFRGNPLSTWLRLSWSWWTQGYPKNSEDLHKRGRERKANVISFPSFTLPMDRTLCEISSVQKPLCDRQLHSKLSRLKETHWRLKIVDLPYGFPSLQRNAQKLSRNSSFHMAEIGHSTARSARIIIQRILKTCISLATKKSQSAKLSIISRNDRQMDQTLCEISSVQKPLCDRQLHSKLSRLKETHWRLKIVDLPYGFPSLQRNAEKLSRKSSFHMAEIGHSTARIIIQRILKTCTSEGEKEKHYSERSANGSDTVRSPPASKSRFVTGNFTQSSLGWKQHTEGWKLSTFLMVSPAAKECPKTFEHWPGFSHLFATAKEFKKLSTGPVSNLLQLTMAVWRTLTSSDEFLRLSW